MTPSKKKLNQERKKKQFVRPDGRNTEMNVRHHPCYPLGDGWQLSKQPRAKGSRRTSMCKDPEVSNNMIILLVQYR